MNFINLLLKNLIKEKYIQDNIWGLDLADMQSLREWNKGIKYLLCTIDLFSKYGWIIPLKDKKCVSIVNAFKKIISKGKKTNKIWGEFYNKSFKDFLKKKKHRNVFNI